MMMFRIEEYRGLNEEKDFLKKAFNGEDATLFWSTHKRRFESGDDIIRLLDEQLKEYHLYFYFENETISAFYIIHSVSIANHRAEIMVFVLPANRGTTSLFSGWVLLLNELHHMSVYHLFAKIFDYNHTSMQMAVKCGFSICGVLPDYIYKNSNDTHNVFVLHRKTDYTVLESRWLKKILSQDVVPCGTDDSSQKS